MRAGTPGSARGGRPAAGTAQAVEAVHAAPGRAQAPTDRRQGPADRLTAPTAPGGAGARRTGAAAGPAPDRRGPPPPSRVPPSTTTDGVVHAGRIRFPNGRFRALGADGRTETGADLGVRASSRSGNTGVTVPKSPASIVCPAEQGPSALDGVRSPTVEHGGATGAVDYERSTFTVLAAAVSYVPYPSWLNPGDNTWQILPPRSSA